MRNDELLKFIQTRINNNLTAAVRQNIYDYLLGKSDDFVVQNCRLSGYYGFVDTVQAELDGESAEMARRCMKVCAAMSPRIIIDANYNNSKRYALYKKADLDFDFVKKDMIAVIERNMYSHLNMLDGYRSIKSAEQYYDVYEKYIYDKGDVTLPHLILICLLYTSPSPRDCS